MIRPLTERDFDPVIAIITESWRTVYAGMVDPALLTDDGLQRQADRLRRDFGSHRLAEYVWEEDGRVLGMLSMGDTADKDRPGAFEIWRVYLSPEVRGQGIGGKLLAFGEEYARKRGYREIVIWAFRENTPAIAFYQKQGYHPDKEEYLGEPYLAWGTRLFKKI